MESPGPDTGGFVSTGIRLWYSVCEGYNYRQKSSDFFRDTIQNSYDCHNF